MTFYEDNPTLQVGKTSDLFWKTAEPESLGFNPKTLQDGNDHLELLPQSASFLVIKGDTLVWEAYFHGTKKEHAKNIHSASKSILSTLYGIALREGDIASLDDPIKNYLDDEFEWKKSFGLFRSGKERITIKHLLELSSGIKWKEDDTEYEIEEEPSWVQAILDLPLIHNPGSTYNYSTGDTHLLSATLTDAADLHLEEYAQKHLFGPLKIKPSHWGKDPDGYNSGGCNLYFAPREVAKLGRLFLQRGKWEGKEIVPESWIDQAWTKYVQIDTTRGYGFLWHIPETLGKRVYKMWGWGGQFLYVLPDDNVAVVITADTVKEYDELNGDAFIEKYVFPALPKRLAKK